MDAGSVLCLPDRTPLGRVEEIFGPVAEPLYTLRFAGGTEVPAGVRQGAAVCSVERFNTYVLAEAVQQARWPPCRTCRFGSTCMYIVGLVGMHVLVGSFGLRPAVCGSRGQGASKSA